MYHDSERKWANIVCHVKTDQLKIILSVYNKEYK